MDAHYVRIHLRLRKGCIDVIDFLNVMVSYFLHYIVFTLNLETKYDILLFLGFYSLNSERTLAK